MVHNDPSHAVAGPPLSLTAQVLHHKNQLFNLAVHIEGLLGRDVLRAFVKELHGSTEEGALRKPGHSILLETAQPYRCLVCDPAGHTGYLSAAPSEEPRMRSGRRPSPHSSVPHRSMHSTGRDVSPSQRGRESSGRRPSSVGRRGLSPQSQTNGTGPRRDTRAWCINYCDAVTKALRCFAVTSNFRRCHESLAVICSALEGVLDRPKEYAELEVERMSMSSCHPFYISTKSLLPTLAKQFEAASSTSMCQISLHILLSVSKILGPLMTPLYSDFLPSVFHAMVSPAMISLVGDFTSFVAVLSDRTPTAEVIMIPLMETLNAPRKRVALGAAKRIQIRRLLYKQVVSFVDVNLDRVLVYVPSRDKHIEYKLAAGQTFESLREAVAQHFSQEEKPVKFLSAEGVAFEETEQRLLKEHPLQRRETDVVTFFRSCVEVEEQRDFFWCFYLLFPEPMAREFAKLKSEQQAKLIDRLPKLFNFLIGTPLDCQNGVEDPSYHLSHEISGSIVGIDCATPHTLVTTAPSFGTQHHTEEELNERVAELGRAGIAMRTPHGGSISPRAKKQPPRSLSQVSFGDRGSMASGVAWEPLGAARDSGGIRLTVPGGASACSTDRRVSIDSAQRSSVSTGTVKPRRKHHIPVNERVADGQTWHRFD